MAQAAICDGLALDPRPLLLGVFEAAEMYVGRDDVAVALMDLEMVELLDESRRRFQLAEKVSMFK